MLAYDRIAPLVFVFADKAAERLNSSFVMSAVIAVAFVCLSFSILLIITGRKFVLLMR